MGRVIHFEIHADDPAACARWYGDMFGWSATEHKEVQFWALATGAGEGIGGGVILRRGPNPQAGAPVNAFVCTIGVDDLEGQLARVLGAGATLGVPKFTIPFLGFSAYVTDPFGNIVGLHQADPNAR